MSEYHVKSSIKSSSHNEPPRPTGRSLAYLRFRRRLVTGLLLMAVVSVALVWSQFRAAHQERRIAVREQTGHYVTAMEAHVRSSIQFVDLSLLGFANAIRILPASQLHNPAAMATLLSSRGASFNNNYWITFLDAQGNAVASSSHDRGNGGADNVSHANRDYFKVHAGNLMGDRLYVGAPAVAQPGQPSLFFLSRRVESEDGAFLGVVLAPLNAARYADVFENSRFSPDVSIALVHGNGRIIARVPGFEQSFGIDLANTILFDQLRKAKSGSFTSNSVIDHQSRVLSYRMLDDFPLIVVVGSSDAASARVLEQNFLMASGGLTLLLLLMLIGGHFSLRTYLRQEERESRYRQLYAASRELEESMQLAELLYQNTSQGMMATDAMGRIVSINPAFAQLSGYSEVELIGHFAYELTAYRHDMAFFTRMQESIGQTGQWEGELWHQHKNGEQYLALLRFNTVYDKQQKAYRRVALVSDITKKKATEELIWTQANFDALTGLPNRRMFHERLRLEMKKTDRTQLPMALVFIDLDHFKEINDTLGHDRGDLLLKEVAQRLSHCVRGTDTVSRLGGDEFTVILSQLHSAGDVMRVAQDILANMHTVFMLGDDAAHISASIGITLYPDDGVDVDTLLQNADQAMYAAKQQGRDRFHYFAPFMQQATRDRINLGNELRDAVQRNELRILFQPIVELATGRIVKAEALVRWQHPQRGLLNPAEFIGIAENIGMIVGIGDWVFEQAARVAKRLQGAGGADFQVSVNKSAWQFRDDGSNYRQWLAYLEELDLPARSMIIEVTENLLLDQGTAVSERLLAFQHAHMQISLDDFGTGYCSVAFLKRFAIDYIKIDPTLVTHLAEGADGIMLCEAIIAMAHKLGIQVIAEGIENQQQMLALQAAGCDFGQGYLFARPMSADELAQQVERQVQQQVHQQPEAVDN